LKDYEKGVSLELYNQLINLLESGFPIREYTQVFEEIAQRIPVEYVDKDFYTYFPFSRNNQNKLYQFFHRVFDIFSSFIGIYVLALMLPFIILFNIFWNRGSLFYTQTRIGLNDWA